jgi:hypothetical protein
MAGRSAMKRYLFALAFCFVFANTASAVKIIEWTHANIQIVKTCRENFACVEWARKLLQEYCDSHRVDKKWSNPDFIKGMGDRGFANVEECRDRWADELHEMPAVRLWNFPENTPEEDRMIGINPEIFPKFLRRQSWN